MRGQCCLCVFVLASLPVSVCVGVCWCVLYAYAVRRCIDRHTHSVTSSTAASRASQSTTFVLQSIGGSSSSCPNVNRHNKTRFETYTRRHHLSSFPPMTIVVASLTHRRTALHCPHQQHCTKFCLERKKNIYRFPCSSNRQWTFIHHQLTIIIIIIQRPNSSRPLFG